MDLHYKHNGKLIMKEKRILIIGSSMAMPRNIIKYEETWIYKLKRSFPNYEIIDKSRRASTTNRLVTEGGGGKGDIPMGADLLEYYSPDIVIIQIGITDCAPRLLNRNKFSTKFLNRLPLKIRSNVYRYLKKNKVRKKENSYITPDDFRNNLIDYFERSKNIQSKIIVILISKPTRLVLSKNPELNENIEKYNKIFIDTSKKYDVVKCIIPFEDKIDMEKIAIDEFHVNEIGHEHVFNKLKRELLNV